VSDERRHLVRVSADCPVLYRILGSEPLQKRERDRFDPISSAETFALSSNIGSSGNTRDDQVMEMLLWIDWKLNYLIKNMPQEKEKSSFPHEAVMVDLSASGMRFSSRRKEAVGTRLEFQFFLPILPFKEMLLVGEVLRSKENKFESDSDSPFEMAVEFQTLRESDEDALFRYILKRDRQIRHEQRGQATSYS